MKQVKTIIKMIIIITLFITGNATSWQIINTGGVVQYLIIIKLKLLSFLFCTKLFSALR